MQQTTKNALLRHTKQRGSIARFSKDALGAIRKPDRLSFQQEQANSCSNPRGEPLHPHQPSRQLTQEFMRLTPHVYEIGAG